MFHTSSPDEFDSFLEEVHSSITEIQNIQLMAKATEAEVKTALFMMRPEKALGPDGMTALFCQQSWSIIKKDVMDMVNNFFTT